MSAVEDITPVSTDQQTNLVDAFEYFSKDKEDQLRQLKPFFNKSSAYLTELIQKAWNSFTEDEKALYSEEANYVVPDTEEMKKFFSTEPLKERRKHADYISDYEENEYDEKPIRKVLPVVQPSYSLHIYIKEISKIIYQGNDISCPHHELVKMLWTRSWMMLKQEQRNEYMTRAKKVTLLSLDESTLNYTAEKKFQEFQTALMDYCEGMNFDDSEAESTFHRDLCSHWTICEDFVRMWYTFTDDQRSVYYDRHYEKLTLEYAQYLYICEAEKKLTPDHVKGRYCLGCDFDNLSDADKKPYIEESKKRVEEAKNSEDGTVFIRNELSEYNFPRNRIYTPPLERELETKEYSGTPFIVRQFISHYWFDPDYNKKSFDDHVLEEFTKEFCNHYRSGYCEDFVRQKWCDLSDAQQREYYEKYWEILYGRYAQYMLICDNVENPWFSSLFDEPDRCFDCWYGNMDAEEKKPYLKRGKRRVKKEFLKPSRRKQRRNLKKSYSYSTADEVDGDTMHFWTEYEEGYAYCKKYWGSTSVAVRAFMPYFEKSMPSFKKQSENQNLPYLRICEKLEKQFWELPAEERQPYFDYVLRQNQLIEMMEPLEYDRFAEANINSLNESKDPSEKPISDPSEMSENEKAYLLRKLRQARIQFLHDNPDVTDYFYFDTPTICTRLTDNKQVNTEEIDKLRHSNKKVPTAFICFVHDTLPMMLQNPEFAAKDESEQRSILKAAWKKLNKEEKVVFYEKEQRALSRFEMKLFYQQYIDLVPYVSDE